MSLSSPALLVSPWVLGRDGLATLNPVTKAGYVSPSGHCATTVEEPRPRWVFRSLGDTIVYFMFHPRPQGHPNLVQRSLLQLEGPPAPHLYHVATCVLKDKMQKGTS